MLRQIIRLRPLVIVLRNPLAPQAFQRIDVRLEQHLANGLHLAQLHRQQVRAARGIGQPMPLRRKRKAIRRGTAALPPRQRHVGLGGGALQPINRPAERRAEFLAGDVRRLGRGNAGTRLKMRAGLLQTGLQLRLLLFGGLNVIHLVGAGMGPLLIQPLQLVVLFLELPQRLGILLSFGIKIPAGQPHQHQRHEAPHQKIQIALDPIHNLEL